MSASLEHNLTRVEGSRRRLQLSLLPPASALGQRFGDPDAGMNTAKTTVGIMFRDLSIEDLWVGGPAHEAGGLACGDVVVAVDGCAVSVATLQATLLGPDVPGTAVELTVRKHNSGRVERVTVSRADARLVKDVMQLSTFFAEQKETALRVKDAQRFIATDQALKVWGRIVHDHRQRDARQHQARSICEEMNHEMDALLHRIREIENVAGLSTEKRGDLMLSRWRGAVARQMFHEWAEAGAAAKRVRGVQLKGLRRWAAGATWGAFHGWKEGAQAAARARDVARRVASHWKAPIVKVSRLSLTHTH